MKALLIVKGEWIFRYRWFIILTTLLLVTLTGMGLPKLGINNDMRVFFSDDNPQLLQLETIEKIFTKNESILIALAPDDGNVFTRETLAAVEELTALSWKIPYSSRVDSITNFQDIKVNEDDLIVEDLVQDAGSLSDEEIAYCRETVLAEPLLLNRLISESGDFTGININILKPKEDPIAALKEISREFMRITSAFQQKYPHIKLYPTGLIMFDIGLGETSQYEMSTLIPIMFLILIVLMLVTLRSLPAILLTFVVILFSVITGMGCAGWLGMEITPPSSNAPIVILTLAVADCIHLLVTLLVLMRKGQNRHTAINESLRINTQAILLTSFTTAVGFLSMNYSEVPPFRDLGNMVAIGVVAAFFYSIFFLPAMLHIVGFKTKVNAHGTTVRHSRLNRFAHFIVRRKEPVFWVSLAISLAVMVGMVRIELDDDYIRYFGKRYDFRNHSDTVMENLTGLYTIEYPLDSGEVSGINEPEFLKVVDNFSAWYATQPHVVNVNSYTHTLKKLNKKLNGDDEAFYRIPDDRLTAAQYLLLYEMSLPFGLELNDQINVQKSSMRVVVTLSDLTAREMREADQRAYEWLQANAPQQMVTHGTGLSLLYAHMSGRCIKSMLWATFGAVLLISFILMIALWSFKLGVVSLIPNMVPAFIAFGIWGFTAQRVGIALSVLAAVTIGIVVDDTIHFLSKYLTARRKHGLTAGEAVIYAFDTVGAALLFTTITLSAGFLVLSVSGFKPSSDLGAMTFITIVCAIILDFLLLPTLLLKLDKADYAPAATLAPGSLEESPALAEVMVRD